MPDRYFCPDLSSAEVMLTDAEAHHAVHVMRVKAGQSLVLFDGAGTSAVATVTEVGRRDVRLMVQSRHLVRPTDRPRITVAAAAPKGERLKWLVEKLTELEVDELILVRCQRTVADPKGSRAGKLTTTVINAAKQCGRDWLMPVVESRKLSDVLADAQASHTRVLMAHPGQHPGLSRCLAECDESCLLLIGPEGGFTDEEVRLAQESGVQLFSRPGCILRTETAAIAFAAVAREILSSQ